MSFKVIKSVSNTVTGSLATVDSAASLAHSFVEDKRIAYDRNSSIRKVEHVSKGMSRIAEARKDFEEMDISEDMSAHILGSITEQYLAEWEIPLPSTSKSK